MAYIAPLHRPSGVRTAVKLNFLSSDEESLVVAKANRLEIYQITADGIILQHAKTIYGTITILAKLRPPDSETDILFVGTDRYSYFTLVWNAEARQLETSKSYVDIADKLARPSQSIERYVVDPKGRFILLEIFEGTLTLIPLYTNIKGKTSKEEWGLGDPIPMRISERFVRSLCFLHTKEVKISKKSQRPRIAIVYNDRDFDVRKVIHEIDYSPAGNDPGSADFVSKQAIKSDKGDIEGTASHIIPVEGPIYGSIVLSEGSVNYFDDAGTEQKNHELSEATVWSTWAQVDSGRWLLADDYGNLYFLGLSMDEGFGQNVVSKIRLDHLGTSPRASVLVYLDAGYFYVGSASGDSQVLRIGDTGKLEIVQTLSSLGPITDFTIMDMGSRSGEGQANEYSSGQARIVTGSGAFTDGSLRSVRSGVGVEELGSIPGLERAISLFPVSSATEFKHDTIIASFVNETRVFQFSEDGNVEEVDSYKGLLFNKSTILIHEVARRLLLQVTSSGAQLLDMDSGMVIDSYSADHGTIVAASANNHFVVLSLDDSTLVTLELLNNLKLVSSRIFDEGLQTSCLHLPTVDQNIVLVGFWQKSQIAVLKIAGLETLLQQSISTEESAVPRSLVLTQLLPYQNPTLLAAMADGTVVAADFDPSNYNISNPKSTILGTQQATLQILPREGDMMQVFAACENPSLIYGSENRLIYSAITVKDVACVCPFDSEAYPGAIAIASSSDLKIALIDNERTTHVQSLPTGETVRRLVYSPTFKAFGLGGVRRTLVKGIEMIQSSFRLVDEVVFQPLDSYTLDDEEIIESVARAQLRSADGKLEERFVVGTAFIEDGTEEAVRGRILLFEVSQDRKLTLLAQQTVKSACRALAEINGKLIAALMKTVVVYSVEHNIFSKQATMRTATAPVDIVVKDDLIAIADLMKSMSIARFIEGEAGEKGKLVEIARHFESVWSTAIADIGDDRWLEADAEGNLMVLQRNIDGLTPEDRHRLQIPCNIRLGEMVNKIRSISVSPSTTAPAAVIPKAFLATVEGSLYLFGIIRPGKEDLLMSLQSNMARLVKSPGSIPFRKYRAYHSRVHTEDEPYRFVDGELIESFLDCDASMQADMVKGLSIGIDEVRTMIENLRRMH